MKLKSIIIEDEEVSRDILRNYLKKYCPDVEICGEAANIKTGLELIESNTPDLVFLDVEMPYGNAFDLLDQVKDRNFEVIFVTAYNHYAMDALNHHAAYYLMKPIDIDELIKGVSYIKEIKEKENVLKNEFVVPKATVTGGKVTVPMQDGFEVINVDDIFYCKADDNYTEIVFENRKMLVSKTLKHFEDLLKPYLFARVHKSFLVNVSKIVKYKKGKGGSVVLSDGVEIMVSASKKSELLSYFE